MQILPNNGICDITLTSGESRQFVVLDPDDFCLNVSQQEGSTLTLHCIHLAERGGKCDITVRQDAARCNTRIYGMALLQGDSLFKLNTHVRHNIGGGFSDQLVKLLADDQSHASFYGELVIVRDAQQTEAHQTNRNILLSPYARIDTKPQLEIYADDVKASHGATTGQLDSAALFYMQQRGIPLPIARRMLLSAFLSDILTTLPDKVLINTLSARIDEMLG